MVRVADRLESQGTLSPPSDTRHSVFIHRRYHDPGRWRARASPGPISDELESDPGPKFISFTSVTCVQLGHLDLGSVAPLVAGWPSKLCSLAVPGGRHGNVGHPSTADGFAMPPCVRSRARGRPHGPPHTTGFTVLFRMGPSWGCFQLAVAGARGGRRDGVTPSASLCHWQCTCTHPRPCSGTWPSAPKAPARRIVGRRMPR